MCTIIWEFVFGVQQISIVLVHLLQFHVHLKRDLFYGRVWYHDAVELYMQIFFTILIPL